MSAGVWWEKLLAAGADGIMCGMMNSLQWKLRHLSCNIEELEVYLARCEEMDRDTFYCLEEGKPRESGGILEWQSPHPSGYKENDIARAEIFWGNGGKSAPTVFLLHALMSAHAGGYRKLARSFNEKGWTVVFPHLPYHYSRVPKGQRNGSLTMTAHLIRNAEGLRQAVKEMRQLRAWLRLLGVEEFGLIGTSYGGWVGALTSFVEKEWKFLALVQPIANVDHAIWLNPASKKIREILLERGISRDTAGRHAHLSSPMHGVPQMDVSRVVLCSGKYDLVSPPSELQRLATAWGAPPVLEVRQGHFGYKALPRVLEKVGYLMGEERF